MFFDILTNSLVRRAKMGFLNKWSVTIGKIYGIPLKLHITFFVLAPIWIWLLGNYFALRQLEMPLWQYYGVLGAGSFLAMEISIILHELGHCWVDKKNGIAIKNITLSAFGGAAFAEKEPETAPNEFRMAIAGPAVSFILAGVFFATQRFLFENTGLNSVSLIANMIFLANLVLGAFNIFVPAFPMDGGRILRSVLWKKMSRLKATHYALIVGKIFGLVLMAGGLASVFFMKNWLGGAIMSGIGLGLLMQKQKEQIRATPQTPVNAEKKKNWIIILVCLGSLLLVSASVLFFSMKDSDVKRISYSGPNSFVEKADNGQLKTLHTSGQVYRGTYEENGKLVKFETVVPLATYFYIGQNSYNPEEYYRILYKGLYKKDLEISTEPYRSLPGIETYVFYGFAFIALIVGFAAVWYWLWGKQMQQTKKFLETAARKFSGNVKFDDIGGLEEEKKELKEIVYFTKYYKRYNEVGARTPRGVILWGPHGGGKTLLAKAVANEANVPVFGISGSEFVEMFVGVGAARVKDLFGEAKRNAPCIIFVDEIDALLVRRGSDMGGGAKEEKNQTVNQFLVETDGIESGQGIVIIGATNRLDMIDPASMRSGRFDRKIEIHLPDIQGRIEMFKIHTKNKPLAENINLEKIAKETKLGTSGADIATICNEAAILAVRERIEEEQAKNEKIDTPIKISKAHFSEAMDKVFWGLQNKKRLVDDEEKEIITYHESGHATINRYSKHLDPVRKVTIVRRGSSLGYVDTATEKESFLIKKEKLEEMGLFTVAGLAAEKVFLGTHTTGPHQDLIKATILKLRMKYQYGMGKMGPVGIPLDDLEGMLKNDPFNPALLKAVEEIAPEIQADLERAENILREHEIEVKKLVEELKKRETIMGDEFIKILEDAKAQTASGN